MLDNKISGGAWNLQEEIISQLGGARSLRWAVI